MHTPLQARADLQAKYDAKSKGDLHNNAKYAAMIEAMDLAIEKVLKRLEDLDLTENTIVIFTSDNGPAGVASHPKPLRGTKGMFYEGGIRVPFIVKWPGMISAGAINHRPISQIDLFPTFLRILNEPVSTALDGKSILPLWRGASDDEERSFFWHFPAYLQMGKNDRGFEESYSPPYWRSTPCGVIPQRRLEVDRVF